MFSPRAHVRLSTSCNFVHTSCSPLRAHFVPEKEIRRKAINEWIRNGKAFDGVIDFDKAVRDPQHPDRILPAYDSGDHLHPGDAGYKAMGEAIDLKLFR